VFSLPLLPLAAGLRFGECRKRAVRRTLLLLGGASAVLVGSWAWILLLEMSDPGIIRSGQLMWSLTRLWQTVSLQPVILIVLLDILVWGALGWRRDRATLLGTLLGFPAIAVMFALLHTETVVPESHYYIRTALVFILPVLGALALWRGRTPPRGAITLTMMAALAVTQLVHDVRFLDAWRNYRDSVAASVATDPVRIVPLRQVLAARAEPGADSIAWSWGEPYLSLTLPGLPRYAAIVADPEPGSYSPFRCSQMDSIAARADWVQPETLAMLKRYVCARRPE